MQSGALAGVILRYARSRAIGLSTLATVGNEAQLDIADVAEHLVNDPDTRAFCMFLETIRDPARFAEVAVLADRAGKPLVALKVGRSEAGQRAALAHTGAIAGDDAVVDAVVDADLRSLNVIRVDSLEELLDPRPSSVTTATRAAAAWVW